MYQYKGIPVDCKEVPSWLNARVEWLYFHMKMHVMLWRCTTTFFWNYSTENFLKEVFWGYNNSKFKRLLYWEMHWHCVQIDVLSLRVTNKVFFIMLVHTIVKRWCKKLNFHQKGRHWGLLQLTDKLKFHLLSKSKIKKTNDVTEY